MLDRISILTHPLARWGTLHVLMATVFFWCRYFEWGTTNPVDFALVSAGVSTSTAWEIAMSMWAEVFSKKEPSNWMNPNSGIRKTVEVNFGHRGAPSYPSAAEQAEFATNLEKALGRVPTLSEALEAMPDGFAVMTTHPLLGPLHGRVVGKERGDDGKVCAVVVEVERPSPLAGSRLMFHLAQDQDEPVKGELVHRSLH